MVKKEIMVAGVIELAAVVTLQDTNGERKVSVHIALEIDKYAMNI